MQASQKNLLEIVFTLNEIKSYTFRLQSFDCALCCLAFHSCSLFSFQGADSDRLRPELNTQELEYLIQDLMVEIIGLEPMTPCLQSRCSPS